MANTYAKFCPNVFVAKCEEPHKKGDIITVETKYGKENEHEVWNLVAQKNGFYYYSITRTDGYDFQERARQRAEKLAGYAASAEAKSSQYCEKAFQAVAGIVPGQPILTDHYSARYHRNALKRSDSAMRQSVELSQKAESYQSRIKYWEEQAEKINLSMPESIDYYQALLERAEDYHAKLKSGELPREHAYSLTYAKKDVNEARKNLELAIKLWGNNESDTDNTNPQQ